MFRAPCSSGGWMDGGAGWLGGAHTCTCMHAHAHAHVVNMLISCKWPPHWGNPWEFPMMSYACMHACMCMHVHVCGRNPLTTPIRIHPSPHPRGDPQNQSKFNSTWTNRDISIPFEDLKSVETSPPMGGCIVRWVGQWVNLWDQVKWLTIV